jgi:hypothetical protein
MMTALFLPWKCLVGMAINCAWMRLTVSKCVSLSYSPTYCNQTVINPANATETILWDYSGCPGTNTLRTISQHLFIVSVFFYFISIHLDLTGSTKGGEAVAVNTVEEI